MRKCANISPYMRRPLVIYDFATATANESKGVHLLDDALYDSCMTNNRKKACKKITKRHGVRFSGQIIHLAEKYMIDHTCEVGSLHVSRQLTFPLVAPVLEPDFNLKTGS